jgi:hypothetical protein
MPCGSESCSHRVCEIADLNLGRSDNNEYLLHNDTYLAEGDEESRPRNAPNGPIKVGLLGRMYHVSYHRPQSAILAHHPASDGTHGQDQPRYMCRDEPRPTAIRPNEVWQRRNVQVRCFNLVRG